MPEIQIQRLPAISLDTVPSVQADIDLLLSDDDPSNDGDAVKLQLKLNGERDQITFLADTIVSSNNDIAEVRDAERSLRARAARLSAVALHSAWRAAQLSWLKNQAVRG